MHPIIYSAQGVGLSEPFSPPSPLSVSADGYPEERQNEYPLFYLICYLTGYIQAVCKIQGRAAREDHINMMPALPIMYSFHNCTIQYFIRTLLFRYLKIAADSGIPRGALQRRGEPELPLPRSQHGRNGDVNADAA